MKWVDDGKELPRVLAEEMTKAQEKEENYRENIKIFNAFNNHKRFIDESENESETE